MFISHPIKACLLKQERNSNLYRDVLVFVLGVEGSTLLGGCRAYRKIIFKYHVFSLSYFFFSFPLTLQSSVGLQIPIQSERKILNSNRLINYQLSQGQLNLPYLAAFHNKCILILNMAQPLTVIRTNVLFIKMPPSEILFYRYVLLGSSIGHVLVFSMQIRLALNI